MFEVGDLVRYHTIEHFYYGLSDHNSSIGLVVNTRPTFTDNSCYDWYLVLLEGKIRTAREDDIFKLRTNKHDYKTTI
jgi:hypothetical protein